MHMAGRNIDSGTTNCNRRVGAFVERYCNRNKNFGSYNTPRIGNPNQSRRAEAVDRRKGCCQSYSRRTATQPVTDDRNVKSTKKP